MTPAQFSAIAEHQGREIKRQDIRTGVLQYVVRRVVGDDKADIYDFCQDHKPPQEETKQNRLAEQKKNLQALVEAQKRSRG